MQADSGNRIIDSNFESVLSNIITPSIQHSIQQANLVNILTANQIFGEKIFCKSYASPSSNSNSQFKFDSFLRNIITHSTRENHAVDD